MASHRPDHPLKLVVEGLGSYYVMKTPEGSVYDDVPNELRVLDIPKHVCFDLNDGYVPRSRGEEPFYPFPSETVRFSKGMSNWILKNKDVLQVKSDVKSECLLNTDFITARGLLSRVMTTPYSYYNKSNGCYFDDWLVCATKFKGTIYLCNEMTENQKKKDSNRYEKFNPEAYGGLRFKEYVTSDDHATLPCKWEHHEKIVHNCVVKSQLGSHSLVCGGQIDCLTQRSLFGDYQLGNFVELKTTKTPETPTDRCCLKIKMVRWWAQCHVIGIPTIVYGLRDNNMVVRDVKSLQVEKMPEECKSFWEPKICLNYLDWFLSFVKGIVVEDDPTVVYEFRKSNADIYDIKITKTDGNERRVLDDEYINSF